MTILVTGGAGYIGSHTCIELLNEGHEVVVVDNLSNSNEKSLRRVQSITGQSLDFHQVDLVDKASLNSVFEKYPIDVVIHFAGVKAVEESTRIPIHYYRNNVMGTVVLCEVMSKHKVHSMVFSSSCTVYGTPDKSPVTEDSPLAPVNPYGRSKLMVEKILKDIYRSDNSWNIISLRYFNPIGAHSSGKIGEDPLGIPNNLLPFVAQVAIRKRPKLLIFGNDYPTHDGTAIRDYIHVVDLSLGHLKAVNKLKENPGFVAYNLGTGAGYSVLDVVKAFDKVSGRKVPFEFAERRPGDASIIFSDPTLAMKTLDWSANKSLEDMCSDTWNWQSANPNGYLS